MDLYEGRDRYEGEALSLAISARVARAVEPYTDGLYLMTPFHRVGLMTRLLREVAPDPLMKG